MKLDLDPEKERRIVRMTALRAAVDSYKQTAPDNHVLATAESFVDWIYKEEE